MDCERFDAHLLDALYGELDEVTHAAMRRHGEACAKCASRFAGLRATREVGVLPMVEPPGDLEARILDAAARALDARPLSGKLLRVLSWAGAQARRPELAAAAIFVLVIGSAVALLRSPQASAPTASASREIAPAAAAPAEPAAAAPAPEAAAAAAADEGEGEGAKDASGAAVPRGLADGVGAGLGLAPGGARAEAALEAARASRREDGCKASIDSFEAVASRFPGTAEAREALEEGAACCAQVGQKDRADRMLALARTMAPREDGEPVAAAPPPRAAAKASKPAASPQKSSLVPPAKAAPSSAPSH